MAFQRRSTRSGDELRHDPAGRVYVTLVSRAQPGNTAPFFVIGWLGRQKLFNRKPRE